MNRLKRAAVLCPLLAVAAAPATRPAVERDVVIVAATAIDRSDPAAWKLTGPCAVRHESAGYALGSKGDLVLRPTGRGPSHIRVTGAHVSRIGPGDSAVIQQAEDVALSFHGFVDVRVLTPADLDAVPQTVDDARLAADADPADVLRYVYREGAAGNFAPLLRVSEGSRRFAKLADDKLRAQAAEATGKPLSAFADAPREALLRAVLVKHWWPEAVTTTNVKIQGPSLTRADAVTYTTDRVGGGSGGTLVRDGGRWRFD